MRKRNIHPFTICIDTRERIGYSFVNSITAHLETGDYQLLESPKSIVIERKNPEDAVSTIINNRDRFILEMQRMQEFHYRAIVIESSLADMLRPYRWSKSNPKAVVQSYLSFSVRYNVHVIWAGSRELGKAVTLRLLEWAWEKRCRELGLI